MFDRLRRIAEAVNDPEAQDQWLRERRDGVIGGIDRRREERLSKTSEGQEKLLRRAVRVAAKKLRAAETEHTRSVAAAEKALEEAGHPRFLGAIGDLQLWDDRLVLPSGSRWLTTEVTASVEAAGTFSRKQHATLSRMLASTLLGHGPVQDAIARKQIDHDLRELYVVVEADHWSHVLSVPPDDGLRARQIAAAIGVAARNVGPARESLARRVAEAKAALQAVRDEVTPMAQAQQGLRAAEEALAAFTQLHGTSTTRRTRPPA